MNSHAVLKHKDKEIWIKFQKLKIGANKLNSTNYIDNTVMIFRNLNYFDLTGFSIVSNNSMHDKLISAYNSCNLSHFWNMQTLILMNRNILQNISKTFKINSKYYILWKGCKVTDSLSDIKEKQLSVVLYSTNSDWLKYYSELVFESIKNLNLIGIDWDTEMWQFHSDIIWNIIFKILDNPDPNIKT